MDLLRALLPKTLRRHGLEQQAESALICYQAERWYADHLPAVAQSLRSTVFRDGVLQVECETSIAAQELRLHEAALLAALQESVPGTRITGLRISRAN